MKTLRDYFMAEDAGATSTSSEVMSSPLTSAGGRGPDPTKTHDGKRELKIGDFVKVITEKVYGYGETGQIVNMDSDGMFVVVKLKNNVEHKYKLSSLEFSPFAKETKDDDDDRELRNLKIMAGIPVTEAVQSIQLEKGLSYKEALKKASPKMKGDHRGFTYNPKTGKARYI